MDLWEKLKILRSFGLDKKKDFNFSLVELDNNSNNIGSLMTLINVTNDYN